MSSAGIITHFGAAVRNLRFRLGISQEELAERADLHRTYIAGIERGGRNVTLKSVAKLADALKVSVGDLLSPVTEAMATTTCLDSLLADANIVNILLVQNDQQDAATTLEAFRGMKIANRVQVISDGFEALRYIFGERAHTDAPLANVPNLILLDLNLSKISAFEVLRRIKQDSRTRRIPVVVLTPSPEGPEVAESRRLGAETHIVKPVDFYSFSQVTPQFQFHWALFEPPKTDLG